MAADTVWDSQYAVYLYVVYLRWGIDLGLLLEGGEKEEGKLGCLVWGGEQARWGVLWGFGLVMGNYKIVSIACRRWIIG